MADLPEYIGIKFKIRKIIELPNKDFKVEFETKYGIKKITFKEEERFLNIATGKPQFLHSIKEFVEKKYSKLKIESDDSELKDFVGLDIDSSNIEDRSVEYLSAKVKKTNEERYKEKRTKLELENKQMNEIIQKLQEKRIAKKKLLLEQKKLENIENIEKGIKK